MLFIVYNAGAKSEEYGDPTTGPFWMSAISCDGTEDKINDCRQESWASNCPLENNIPATAICITGKDG